MLKFSVGILASGQQGAEKQLALRSARSDRSCPVFQHWLIDFSLLCTGTPLALSPSVVLETSKELRLLQCPSDGFNLLAATGLTANQC